MSKFIRITVATVTVAMLATTVTHAHAIWFAQRSSQLALIFGAGGADEDMIRRLPTVKDIRAYDDKGKELPTKLVPSGPLALVDLSSAPTFVAAVMDYGLWSRTPDGKWYGKGKDETPGAEISRRSYKYAVHLQKELTGPVPLLPGQTLQIIPETLPAMPRRISTKVDLNTPLKLRVMFKGEPAVGAHVIPDWLNDPDAEPLITDKAGSVTVKVRNHGLNVIHAILEAPPEDPVKTLVTEHAASLSFIVPNLPE